MTNINAPAYSFNRGAVGKASLGRVDVEKLRLSAEIQTNWMPYVVGPMQFRPGTAYIGETKNDAKARQIPFIFSKTDTALIEFTDSTMRVRVSDALITRVAVATTITNGAFGGAGSWTLVTTPDAIGALADINSTNANALTLGAVGRGAIAQATQQVTVAGGDLNKEHALRISVTRGPVTFRCGSTSGGFDYVAESSLNTGTHSLAFTPTGNFWVQFETQGRTQKIVSSCQVEAAGVMELPLPYALSDLYDSNGNFLIRYAQSGDIIYLANKLYRPRKIERRTTRSWSITLYQPNNGPLVDQTIAQQGINLSCDTTEGNGTLNASVPLFDADDVGQLYYLFVQGQNGTYVLSAPDRYTDSVRVNGAYATSNDRNVLISVGGTWAGTVTAQISYNSSDAGFIDGSTVTSTTTMTATPHGENVIAWVRSGFKTTAYTSGTAVVTYPVVGLTDPIGGSGAGSATYPAAGAGGGPGIVRITSIVSSTAPVSVSASTAAKCEITQAIPATQATNDWKKSEWYDGNIWPSAVGFFDGRLWWAGADKVWGSVSDDYENFSVDVTGDSAPLNRSIGFGPIGYINWILPLLRLLLGRDMSETAIRSSSFDQPVTPTNFTMKDCSTQGSARVQGLKVDNRGVFVQQSRRKVYELAFDPYVQDYAARDLTRLNLDIGSTYFNQAAVQRQPDTYLHFVNGNGTLSCLLYDVPDAVEAWWTIQTNGTIEDVAVLPGDLEDQVYITVARTINGVTKRYVEKFARRDECVGGTVNKNVDSHVVFSQAPSTTVSGLSNLEGQTVCIWADGVDQGTAVVSGGSITLGTPVSNGVVGLSYTAQFQSAKLAYAAQKGTAINQTKRVDEIGFVLLNTHYQGVQYGPDFNTLQNLPLMENSVATPTNTVWTEYDQRQFTFPGHYNTDSRMCLQASSPRPATVLNAIIGIRTDED